ncbi:MAG: carbonic anhydrase [Halieaceae bacterium]
MITPQDALDRLKQGNRRFLSGDLNSEILASPARRDALIQDQRPFAIILGCSDSRVPAEIIFDRGLGDLFVIRVAGNVVAPSQIGSIEYAAEMFGTRLVVVLGHSNCGAVQATLDELHRPSENRSPNLRSIVGRITPAIEGLLAEDSSGDGAALMPAAVEANIHASVEQLKHGSEILEVLIDAEALRIVGAQYSLETGEVHFYE